MRLEQQADLELATIQNQLRHAREPEKLVEKQLKEYGIRPDHVFMVNETNIFATFELPLAKSAHPQWVFNRLLEDGVRFTVIHNQEFGALYFIINRRSFEQAYNKRKEAKEDDFIAAYEG